MMKNELMTPGFVIKNVDITRIPTIYAQITKDYPEQLRDRHAELTRETEKAKKARTWDYILISAILAAAIFIVATVVELLVGLGMKYWVVNALASILAGLILSQPLAKSREKERAEALSEKAVQLSQDNMQYRNNLWLYQILTARTVKNLIMGEELLTVTYINGKGQFRVVTFEYEEWPADKERDDMIPYLIIQNNRLFGKSSEETRSPRYTTSILEAPDYGDEDQDETEEDAKEE